MNIEITKQERNELLEREDIELDINHASESTPSENDVRKKLAAELDLDPTTIQVDHIYSSTGRGFSTGIVTVFDEPVIDELPEESDESEEASEEASTEEEVEEEETEDADEQDTEEDESESEEDVEEEPEEEESEESVEDEEEA